MRRFLVVALLVVACSPSDQSTEPTITTTTKHETTTSTTPTSTEASTTTTPSPAFGISSPAFGPGEPIPVSFTCDGEDASPSLEVVGIPLGTESLALIVDDPEAPLGTWDHWVEYDIAVESGSVQIDRASGPVGTQGVNSWNLPGYGGPCPPEGEQHQYHFRVYALDLLLDLPAGSESTRVYAAMEGHVLDSVELVGVFER